MQFALDDKLCYDLISMTKKFFFIIPVLILFQAFFSPVDLTVFELNEGQVEHARDGIIPTALTSGFSGTGPKYVKKSSFSIQILLSAALASIHGVKPQSVPVYFLHVSSHFCNPSLRARASPIA